MPHRRIAVVLSCGFLVILMGRAAAWGAPPTIQSAVSRMTQGGHAYDVALPVSGTSGVECRSAANGLTIVVGFNQAVTSGKASVSSGKAILNGAPRFSGKTMMIKLRSVGDVQEIALKLDVGGSTSDLKFRVLVGDVNGDGTVDEADVTIAKAQVGAVKATNFRADVATNGVIRASDINQIKADIGHSIGGAGPHSAPVINPIANQKLVSGLTPPGIGIAIKDADTPAAAVTVVATSDNPKLVPPENVLVSGDGADRVLTVTPAPGQSGTVHMTVTASDGVASTSRTFDLNVSPAPSLYVADLRPAGSSYLLGFGQATLLLSADETQATVRLDYSNLTATKSGAHIRGPAAAGQNAGVLLDLGTLPPNADGSYTWVFVPVGGLQVVDIVNAIKNGQTYIDVDSGASLGEIRGQFHANDGSFPTPPAPPALPTAPPTQNDAARFLVQATFGPTSQDIALAQGMGYEAWLAQQFNMPPTLSTPSLIARQGLGETLLDDQMNEAWWGVSLTAPDQLRQRVAFALSEIFVISQNDADLTDKPLAVADYYDMLIGDAFANYRQILEDVTLHPAMGNYLDMRGNRAQYTNSSNQPIIPNENYAREVLQLFSIGLSELQADGSLKLDIQGLPVPTYDQPVVQGFARVFTGWNYHQGAQSTSPSRDDLLPMTLITQYHETGTKQLLDGVVLPAGQTGQKDLGDALNLIFKHPNTGPFICRELIQRLVTDNPSPGYIYRVSQVFADNGQGVRGDMKAVIRAILLDYEARSATVATQQAFGKLKEPLLRATHAIRALHPVSASGYFKIPNTETELTQTPLRSPTVFNFFTPDYAYPGKLTDGGLVAPEFQVTYETSVINFSNFMESSTRTTFKGGDIKVDLATEIALAGGADTGPLVDRLNQILMAGNMSSGMRSTLVTYLNSLTASDPTTRARAAVHLITTSSEYCTQK